MSRYAKGVCDRCPYCDRETWHSRMQWEPPVASEDVSLFCLGASGLSPEACLEATSVRIAKLETDRQRLLDLLHDIGGNYYARRALKQTNLTAPIRASMERKALTDEQIEKLCLDSWESVVLAMQALPRREPHEP